MDALGYPLAMAAPPASEQERARVAELAAQVRGVTSEVVELACVGQGYTGTEPSEATVVHGITVKVEGKLPGAHGPMRRFMSSPRRARG